MRRSEAFLKGRDETSKIRGKWKMGSEVYWSAVKWSEVKGSEVKWNDVKWSEVNIFSETCVLSFTYSYVAVLCSVQYVVSLLFASLCYFLITRIMFLISVYICFCIVFLFPILCIVCFCMVLCIFFSFCMQLSVSYLCTSFLTTNATGWRPNCST